MEQYCAKVWQLRERMAQLAKDMDFEQLRERMAKLVKDMDFDLAQEIFSEKKFSEMVEKSGIPDKIKKIISEHRPSCSYVFVKENLNRPVLEEIFNDYKGNEDIRNALKKYGVKDIKPLMPHLILLEFVRFNEFLIEEKQH